MKYSDEMWKEVESRINSIETSLDCRKEIENYRKQQLAERDPVKRSVLTKGLMSLQRHLLKLENTPNTPEGHVIGLMGSDPNMDKGSPNADLIAQSQAKRKEMAEQQKAKHQEAVENAEYREQMSQNRLNGKML